jgi:hypothetical protein
MKTCEMFKEKHKMQKEVQMRKDKMRFYTSCRGHCAHACFIVDCLHGVKSKKYVSTLFLGIIKKSVYIFIYLFIYIF